MTARSTSSANMIRLPDGKGPKGPFFAAECEAMPLRVLREGRLRAASRSCLATRRGQRQQTPLHHEERLVGIQRIFLDPDDRQHYPRFKPVLCSERRAAMQLAPGGRVPALTEGGEDAIAYTRKNKIPAWGLPGVEWLAHTTIPDSVDELIIAFDRGKPAQSAFEKHADRLRAGVQMLRFDPPPAPSKDWNADLLRGLSGTAD